MQRLEISRMQSLEISRFCILEISSWRVKQMKQIIGSEDSERLEAKPRGLLNIV